MEHTEYGTGSQRDNRDGKGRPDLLSVFALRRDIRHYENGAKKYSERNWELGQPSSSYFCSAFRHMLDYLEGDRDEDHLAAIRWNIAGIIHNEELVSRCIYPRSILDLPDYSSYETFFSTVAGPTKEAQSRKNAPLTDKKI
jgi:hypothetical protein